MGKKPPKKSYRRRPGRTGWLITVIRNSSQEFLGYCHRSHRTRKENGKKRFEQEVAKAIKKKKLQELIDEEVRKELKHVYRKKTK